MKPYSKRILLNLSYKELKIGAYSFTFCHTISGFDLSLELYLKKFGEDCHYDLSVNVKNKLRMQKFRYLSLYIQNLFFDYRNDQFN